MLINVKAIFAQSENQRWKFLVMVVVGGVVSRSQLRTTDIFCACVISRVGTV